MAESFRLPAIGDTMVEGEVVEWLVSVGDEVTLDQPICSLETDKTVVEMTTPFAGVVLQLGGQPGESIAVGDPLIVIGKPGERLEDPALANEPSAEKKPAGAERPKATNKPEPKGGPAISPVVRNLAASYDIDLSKVTGTGPGGRITRGDVQGLVEEAAAAQEASGETPDESNESDEPDEPGESNEEPVGDSILAMPKVRKLAKELDIDLATVTGTGPRGSIISDDLMALGKPAANTEVEPEALPGMAKAEVRSPGDEPKSAKPSTEERRERLSVTRRAIAGHLTKSVQEIPQFTSMIDVNADALLATRAALNERDGSKVPIDALLIKLLIPVLRDHPIINAKLDTGGTNKKKDTDLKSAEIVYYNRFDIGVAVDTPDGLMVPVVQNAEQRSIDDLGSEVLRLAGAARDRSIEQNELTGASCTINNVGALGIVAGTPILPLDTSAIIAFGSIRPTVTLQRGSPVEVQTMTISATFDHRLIDGGTSGRFLADLKRNLEVPALGLMPPDDPK